MEPISLPYQLSCVDTALSYAMSALPSWPPRSVSTVHMDVSTSKSMQSQFLQRLASQEQMQESLVGHSPRLLENVKSF